ncbi:MAG: hypothetical protein KAI40_10890 [Desulfobacterales bacterium]|nr:hypothetical protein [Desulfobacterales bacterium]
MMRLTQASHRRAPVDEVFSGCNLYQERYSDFNVRHFYSWYKRDHKEKRSYSWVKDTLQRKILVPKGQQKGFHRKKRERSPYQGMMIHPDGNSGCTHEGVGFRLCSIQVRQQQSSNS